MWRARAIAALTARGTNAGADNAQAALLACADLLRAEAQVVEETLQDQLLADAFLLENVARGFISGFAVLEGFVTMTAPKKAKDCQFAQAATP